MGNWGFLFAGRSDDLNHFSVSAVWCKENEDGLYDAGFHFIAYEGDSEKLFERLLIDFESTARAANNIKDDDVTQ